MSRTPKYLQGDANTPRLKASQRHERDTAKAMGGITTIGSGAKNMKGDVWAGDPNAGQRLMVENKSTMHASLVLKQAWLEKLVQEAHAVGKEPVLRLRFGALKFQGFTDWAVVPADRLDALLALEAHHHSQLDKG